MEITVLGVCGSPIKGGNTEVLLREALKAAEEIDGVRTELVTLAGKDIRDCRHCNWCLTKQEEGTFCAQKDDMLELYPKVLAADVLLLATPVYTGRLSGYMACFLDRLRAFAFGIYQGRLRNKVGGALAVGWLRNLGAETALQSLAFAFLGSEMILVGPPHGLNSLFGVVGLSSEGGEGKFDPKDKLGVLKDKYGMESARRLGRRTVQVATLLKAGEEKIQRE